MRTILIFVKCAPIEKEWSILISKEMSIKKAIILIYRTIAEEVKKEYQYSEKLMIIEGKSYRILNPDKSFEENDIVSGDKIILF